MREIVLDTETTGLILFRAIAWSRSAASSSSTASRPAQTFHGYLNPERDMPAEAFAVHGLVARVPQDKPFFAEIADDLSDFIGDAPLVAHNAAFDSASLMPSSNARAAAARPRTHGRYAALARRKYPGGAERSRSSLPALRHRQFTRTKHGALLDAELLAEVYVELSADVRRTLILSRRSRPSGGRRTHHRARTTVPLPPRVSAGSSPRTGTSSPRSATRRSGSITSAWGERLRRR